MTTKTLKSSIVGSWIVAAALSLACPATASPRLISVVFNAAPQSPQQVGADQLQRKVAESGRDRIVFDARGGGTLGSEAAILAATQSGAVDVSVLSAAPVSSAVPELGVLDIPFLFRDASHAKAVADGPIGAAIAAKFADKGLVLLAIGKQGFRNITNSKRPIRSPSDLKGLKIRVVPNDVYQMTFKALGAEVVPLDFPLVYAGLKDGRIDGQENPVATIGSSRFQEVQKYLSMTSHFFAGVVFVANRGMFEQLSPADQELLVAAAKAGANATWGDGDQSDAKWLDELRKGGMEVTEKIDRQPFIDAVKSLEPAFEKRFGKDLLAAIRSTP